MIWIEGDNDSVGAAEDPDRDKTCAGFIFAAILCFAISLFLFLGVKNYSICGVTIFSPQVSSSDRLAFLSLPAIPFALGVVFAVLAILLRRHRR